MLVPHAHLEFSYYLIIIKGHVISFFKKNESCYDNIYFVRESLRCRPQLVANGLFKIAKQKNTPLLRKSILCRYGSGDINECYPKKQEFS